jgi:short-subunit dehydrogenase
MSMHIVVGGSDGLGKQLVRSLNASQRKSVNVSRRQNEDAYYNISCDLSSDAGIKTAAEEILAIEQPIEAIYISAGVFSYQKLNDLSGTELDRVFAINTRAPLLLTSFLMERIKSDSTDLIFINSVAGIKSYEDQALYNASKAALHSFTNDLRIQLSKTPSRVIGVYPGMIDTDIAQKLPSGPLPKSKHAMIDPKALADYIVYTQQLPKTIEVSDIILDRKKYSD